MRPTSAAPLYRDDDPRTGLTSSQPVTNMAAPQSNPKVPHKESHDSRLLEEFWPLPSQSAHLKCVHALVLSQGPTKEACVNRGKFALRNRALDCDDRRCKPGYEPGGLAPTSAETANISGDAFAEKALRRAIRAPTITCLRRMRAYVCNCFGRFGRSAGRHGAHIPLQRRIIAKSSAPIRKGKFPSILRHASSSSLRKH